MDRYEKAALLDFLLSTVWPTRTPALVTNPAGQATFTVRAPDGGWATATDMPMAWINGQRVTGTITWVDGYTVTLPSPAPMGSQVVILINPGAGSGYLARSGALAMLGQLNMANFQIANLGASTLAHHAVRRDEVATLVAQLVGGNFVAKSGDTMAGELLQIAANLITSPAAAVRRDMVTLRDGTQGFTARVDGVATIDTDPITTLTTKGWVESYVQAQLAAAQPPNNTATFSGSGSHSWPVPSGVRKIWVYTKGARGGRGGRYTASPDGDNIGGDGGVISGSIPVVPGAIIPIVVGPVGADGGDFWEERNGNGSGGGGGGASQVSVGDQTITGGGGGGGAGQGSANSNTASGCPAGGAGGMQGANGRYGGGQSRPGGLPGNTITTAGGIGGVGSGRNPGPGKVGGGAATGSFNTSDTFPFQVVTDPNAASGVGLVIIKWYEP
jgi:hypothetical protein